MKFHENARFPWKTLPKPLQNGSLAALVFLIFFAFFCFRKSLMIYNVFERKMKKFSWKLWNEKMKFGREPFCNGLGNPFLDFCKTKKTKKTKMAREPFCNGLGNVFKDSNWFSWNSKHAKTIAKYNRNEAKIRKMKNKLKFHDFSSQWRKTLPKPLQNGSLQNFKKVWKFQNILEIFCYFRLLANVVKRKVFEVKSRSLTENMKYFQKVLHF